MQINEIGFIVRTDKGKCIFFRPGCLSSYARPLGAAISTSFCWSKLRISWIPGTALRRITPYTRSLKEAESLYEKGYLAQAGEKYWGAVP
ncbi:PaREP1 family protein [Pyrobaculum aerophilum]|uniref:PaREP1 family protein n=1 Tax=Pyrobaculum aerophilum TaxID=13773 RepID=UPI003C6DE8D1